MLSWTGWGRNKSKKCDSDAFRLEQDECVGEEHTVRFALLGDRACDSWLRVSRGCIRYRCRVMWENALPLTNASAYPSLVGKPVDRNIARQPHRSVVIYRTVAALRSSGIAATLFPPQTAKRNRSNTHPISKLIFVIRTQNSVGHKNIHSVSCGPPRIMSLRVAHTIECMCTYFSVDDPTTDFHWSF